MRRIQYMYKYFDAPPNLFCYALALLGDVIIVGLLHRHAYLTHIVTIMHYNSIELSLVYNIIVTSFSSELLCFVSSVLFRLIIY